MITVTHINDLFHPASNKNSLLGIFAHPDDESFNIGGILAMASKEHIATHLLCLTAGEMGIKHYHLQGRELQNIRKKELHRTKGILGIKSVHIADLPDTRLYYNQRKAEKVIRQYIEKLQPSVVITHDPSGLSGHPDHITTSLCVKRIASSLKKYPTSFYFSVRGDEEKLFRHDIPTMPDPTHSVNVRLYIQIKTAACKNYQSQIQNTKANHTIGTWIKLFDREYLHLIQSAAQYRFVFSNYSSPYFTFSPSTNRHIYVE